MTKNIAWIKIIMSVTSEIAAAAFPSGLCDRGVLPSTDNSSSARAGNLYDLTVHLSEISSLLGNQGLKILQKCITRIYSVLTFAAYVSKPLPQILFLRFKFTIGNRALSRHLWGQW